MLKKTLLAMTLFLCITGFASDANGQCNPNNKAIYQYLVYQNLTLNPTFNEAMCDAWSIENWALFSYDPLNCGSERSMVFSNGAGNFSQTVLVPSDSNVNRGIDFSFRLYYETTSPNYYDQLSVIIQDLSNGQAETVIFRTGNQLGANQCTYVTGRALGDYRGHYVKITVYAVSYFGAKFHVDDVFAYVYF